MFKKIAKLLLDLAEGTYLTVHGWEYEGNGRWTAPAWHPKNHVNIDQGHAMNSTKHHWYALRRGD